MLSECLTYEDAAKELLKCTGSKLPVSSYGKKSFDNWQWQGGIDEHIELWQMIGKFNNPTITLMLLFGIPGVGKTHLALAIGWQRIVGLRQRVIMYQVEVLLDDLRTSFETGEYSNLLNALRGCDLLILDDLTANANTHWSIAKLDALVDYRYSEEKQTIITTNNPVEIPERILDRCKEGAVVRIKGKSWRGVREHEEKNQFNSKEG